MSMIYIKGSITNIKDDFEKNKKSNNSKILISYVDCNDDVAVDDFSVDITLGKSWNENYSYNDRSLFLIEGNSITLKPRTSVVVSIRENITIPNNMFGLVISTGSIFLQHGVQSPTAKIEAGYSGVLVLRLVNYSDANVTINRGDKIASMIFLRTEHTPAYTFATNSESTNIKKKGWLEKRFIKTKNFLSRNISIVIALIACMATVTVCIVNVARFRNDQQNAYEQNLKTQNETMEKLQLQEKKMLLEKEDLSNKINELHDLQKNNKRHGKTKKG